MKVAGPVENRAMPQVMSNPETQHVRNSSYDVSIHLKKSDEEPYALPCRYCGGALLPVFVRGQAPPFLRECAPVKFCASERELLLTSSPEFRRRSSTSGCGFQR